jgi:hypothetical protein
MPSTLPAGLHLVANQHHLRIPGKNLPRQARFWRAPDRILQMDWRVPLLTHIFLGGAVTARATGDALLRIVSATRFRCQWKVTIPAASGSILYRYVRRAYQMRHQGVFSGSTWRVNNFTIRYRLRPPHCGGMRSLVSQAKREFALIRRSHPPSSSLDADRMAHVERREEKTGSVRAFRSRGPAEGDC